ncbi:MAG: hypothetical protein FWC00_05865 [Firmicutes bacterium]|nr:hypothetical protein [Bacillota bacterium]
MSKNLKIIVASCTAVLLVGGTFLGLWLGGVFGRSGTPAWLATARTEFSNATFLPTAEQLVQGSSSNIQPASVRASSIMSMSTTETAHWNETAFMSSYNGFRTLTLARKNAVLNTLNGSDHMTRYNRWYVNSPSQQQMNTPNGMVNVTAEVRFRLNVGETYRAFLIQARFLRQGQSGIIREHRYEKLTMHDDGTNELFFWNFGGQQGITEMHIHSRFNENTDDFRVFAFTQGIGTNTTNVSTYLNFETVDYDRIGTHISGTTSPIANFVIVNAFDERNNEDLANIDDLYVDLLTVKELAISDANTVAFSDAIFAHLNGLRTANFNQNWGQHRP